MKEGSPDPFTANLPGRLVLAPGQSAVYRLVSAAGAGNQWSVEKVAGDDVAAVEVALGPPPVMEGTPPSSFGVPELLKIVAQARGSCRWRLRLARPWTPDQPVAEHILEIVVE